MQDHSATESHITLRLLQRLKSTNKPMKVADSTGVKLSSRDLLIRSMALRRFLLREVIGKDEERVGVFLPPTVPAVAANLALALAGKVAVNLNYTASSAQLKQCCELAGLKHVLTSRKFVDKVGLDVGAPQVFLEDVRDKITIGDKLSALFNVRLRSAASLHSACGLSHLKSSDPLTIIFTSGSTGFPKGVVLTSQNISSNVDGINDAIKLTSRDVIMGILPFFHSFGYTVTIWTALCLECSCVYHFSPLEARPIGKLAQDHGATVLLATPTFLRSYIRRVEPEQFKTLEVVVLGAEKMPLDVAESFEQRFGVRPVEGYGTTELSPVVSVNVPKARETGKRSGLREGSVGLPVTDVEARVVSFDDDQPLPIGESGLLEIRGPNVMQGYLDRPDLTAEVMHDGWYRTGDVAKIDEDGFIYITGRLSRFSKIGGEMIPHILVEQAISDIVGLDDEGLQRVAVSSVTDPKRGERLVVLKTPGISVSPGEILKSLKAQGFPGLYLPSEDSFAEVPEIPMLGTGKLDLKALQQVAIEIFGDR
jgi:acyl-[acyl-carrier-protein]-phospholipid O-acyltransferase / long-chain-fatty-acid--[acyl-carrier-protein] ligase